MANAPQPHGDRLYFGSVKIIESLKPHEQRTGWNLFNELQPIGLMSKPQVTCEYTPLQTAAELRARLGEIRDEVKTTGRNPIVQLETHGNRDGIGLSGGDFVPWPVLRPWLTEINVAAEARIEAMPAAQGTPPTFIEQQRPALRTYLRNFEQHYEETKKNYFFIDLYPENAARFPVTLDDCRLGPSGN